MPVMEFYASKTQISNLVRTTRFWNNFISYAPHHKNGKQNFFEKYVGASSPKDSQAALLIKLGDIKPIMQIYSIVGDINCLYNILNRRWRFTVLSAILIVYIIYKTDDDDFRRKVDGFKTLNDTKPAVHVMDNIGGIKTLDRAKRLR